jgi:hypothetical protein
MRKRRTDGLNSGVVRTVAIVQAIYFALTGVWAIFHIRSFEAITGPKVDRWLVKTVGALVAVVGGVIGMAGARRTVAPETVVLATGCAAALGAIDVVYVAKRRISPVYLLDALGEAVLIAAWVVALRGKQRSR